MQIGNASSGKSPKSAKRNALFVAGVVAVSLFLIVGAGLLWVWASHGKPVASWRAEGNARDSAGHNNGILVGNPKFSRGITGEAFEFDGTGSYAKIPPSASLNPGRQLTIEFWMKAAPGNPMNSFQGLVTTDYYGVEIANGVSFYLTSNRGAAWAITSHASLSAGVWHHVAGTYDGAIVRLYIDGHPWGIPLKHTGAISPLPSDSFVAIGSEDGRTHFSDCIGSRYFTGLIDEVRIYGRALSATEIKNIFDKGANK